MTWTLRPAHQDDLEQLVELRAVVMRPDLERLGRYDEHRVRQRFRDSFAVEHTRIIEVDGEPAGSITLRPSDTPPANGETGGETAGAAAPGEAAPGEAALGAVAGGGQWLLEHFYLEPRYQGHGLGTAVLGTVLDGVDAERATVRLNVLQGSAARKLYERHGFVVESEDPIDVFMIRKFL